MTTNASRFKSGATVHLNAWSKNPLLDDAEQSQPELVRLARLQNGEPPSLFSTGDAPPFTASGIDPSLLRLLPWQMRHAAAQEPDRLTVLGMIEKHANEPDARVPSEGLADYEKRVGDWLSGKWTNPAGVADADANAQAEAEDALYDSLFGAQEKFEAERRDQAASPYDRVGQGLNARWVVREPRNPNALPTQEPAQQPTQQPTPREAS